MREREREEWTRESRVRVRERRMDKRRDCEMKSLLIGMNRESRKKKMIQKTNHSPEREREREEKIKKEEEKW